MNENDTQNLGGFRAMRVAAGLSQEALAREVGCSTGYVRLLERGYRPNLASSPVRARVMARLENDERRPPQSAAVQESVRQDRRGAE